MTRRTARIAASIAISVVFLALAVRNVDWGQAMGAVSGANYLYVLLMLPVTVWTLYIRAQRWRVFLGAVATPPMRPLVSATNIGFMANMILPLRIGEVVRPVLLSRHERLPLSGVLGSVVLERVFDMFTILFLFGVSAGMVAMSGQVRNWGLMLAGLAVVVGTIVALIRWQEGPALNLLRRLCDKLPGRLGQLVYSFVAGFVKALEMLDSPMAFLRAFGWSLYLWFAIASLYVLAIIAFRLPVPLLVGSVVITAIIAIAVSVPSAPGYIGAFQLGCVLALAVFSIPESEAIAFSIVVHLTQFVAVIGAGLYSLWSENMTFSEVEAVEQSKNAAA